MKIKFGTDGWRALIAKDFTVDQVARVAQGTAHWLLSMEASPILVLGSDCRFGGRMFAETVALVMAQNGVKVLWDINDFVSTPMVSLGTVQHQAHAGVILTASHNPPSYNGFKIKASYGGPAIPSMISQVEDLIPDQVPTIEHSLTYWKAQGRIVDVDLFDAYLTEIRNAFDLKAMQPLSKRLAFDAMYGAGQRVIPALFPQARTLHCTHNPGFAGQAPEPIARNLGELSALLASDPSLGMGLAVDGDADRIGLLNASGDFVDSHHILMLLVAYLAGVQGKKGDVVVSFSVSPRMERICQHFGLNLVVTPIGFKYICEIMTQGGVLVGGEESGGIAIDGYIPERDGIWIGLTLMEYMAKSGKTLESLIDEIYAICEPFYYDRWDLTIENDHKALVLANLASGAYTHFGPYTVQRTESTDGYKCWLNDNDWVMFRASGTEPVLRIYAESNTREETEAILKAAQSTLYGA
ncbi:MAG: phosphoglucomutase/phosphomannomutase family protein [Bacteroidia bacterium]